MSMHIPTATAIMTTPMKSCPRGRTVTCTDTSRRGTATPMCRMLTIHTIIEVIPLICVCVPANALSGRSWPISVIVAGDALRDAALDHLVGLRG